MARLDTTTVVPRVADEVTTFLPICPKTVGAVVTTKCCTHRGYYEYADEDEKYLGPINFQLRNGQFTYGISYTFNAVTQVF